MSNNGEGNTLRAGAIVLTLGESFQLLVSILSLIVSLFARHAPMLRMVFADEELPRLDTKANAVVKSLAILHNSGAVLCSVFVLVVIWTSLIDGARWAFWLVLFAGVFGHAMWFVSDAIIGYKTVPVNAILTVVFLVGIGLAGYQILVS